MENKVISLYHLTYASLPLTTTKAKQMYKEKQIAYNKIIYLKHTD